MIFLPQVTFRGRLNEIVCSICRYVIKKGYSGETSTEQMKWNTSSHIPKTYSYDTYNHIPYFGSQRIGSLVPQLLAGWFPWVVTNLFSTILVLCPALSSPGLRESQRFVSLPCPSLNLSVWFPFSVLPHSGEQMSGPYRPESLLANPGKCAKPQSSFGSTQPWWTRSRCALHSGCALHWGSSLLWNTLTPVK